MLYAAAIVVFVLVTVHSVAGELLILRHMHRFGGFPLVGGSDALAKRTVRVTWHVCSLLGVGLGAILLRLADRAPLAGDDLFAAQAIAGSLFACAILGAIGTRGRHPGWVGFLVAATL